MAEFIYRIQPTRVAMLTDGPTERESEVVALHLQYLKRLAERGAVRLAGRTANDDERTFGIVVLEAGSESDAAEIMLNDPAVVQGVMRAELFAFRVAVWGARPALVPGGRK